MDIPHISFGNRLLKVFVGLTLFQLVRIGLTRLLFLFIPNGNVTGHIPNTIIMGVFAVIFLLRFHKNGSQILPPLKTKWQKITLLIGTGLSIFLVFSSLYFDASPSTIYLLFHGSIITPLFEETLFRGLLWSYFKKSDADDWIVFVAITLLFGIWHIGYMDSIAWRVPDGQLLFIMTMKVITGTIVGILTGLARKKSGAIYDPILIHAIWNVFAG